MTIWEKAISSMQKGVDKLTAGAAFFSERVRAEINIVRLRVRIDNVQESINEQHRAIGKVFVDLHNEAALPKGADQLLHHEAISVALSELAAREKDMELLHDEVEKERAVYRPVPEREEERVP